MDEETLYLARVSSSTTSDHTTFAYAYEKPEVKNVEQLKRNDGDSVVRDSVHSSKIAEVGLGYKWSSFIHSVSDNFRDKTVRFKTGSKVVSSDSKMTALVSEHENTAKSFICGQNSDTLASTWTASSLPSLDIHMKILHTKSRTTLEHITDKQRNQRHVDLNVDRLIEKQHLNLNVTLENCKKSTLIFRKKMDAVTNELRDVLLNSIRHCNHISCIRAQLVLACKQLNRAVYILLKYSSHLQLYMEVKYTETFLYMLDELSSLPDFDISLEYDNNGILDSAEFKRVGGSQLLVSVWPPSVYYTTAQLRNSIVLAVSACNAEIEAVQQRLGAFARSYMYHYQKLESRLEKDLEKLSFTTQCDMRRCVTLLSTTVKKCSVQLKKVSVSTRTSTCKKSDNRKANTETDRGEERCTNHPSSGGNRDDTAISDSSLPSREGRIEHWLPPSLAKRLGADTHQIVGETEPISVTDIRELDVSIQANERIA
eukprot:CFRG4520T1